MLSQLRKLLKDHYFLVLALAIGALLRWHNLSESMSFFYDQARDALAAAKILTGDFVLVGPTTDLPGLFFGPLWYYLLAFLYGILSGNPVSVTIVLSFLDLGTIVLLYLIGKKIFNLKTGIIACFLWSLGALPVAYSRTLSNPASTAFWVCLMILSYIKIKEGDWKFIVLIFVSQAVLFQLNAAGAFLMFPATAILVFLIARGKLSLLACKKGLIIGALLFGFSFLPQLFFEVRNSFPGTKTVIRMFSPSGTKSNGLESLKSRIDNLKRETADYTFYGQENLAIIVVLGCFLVSFRSKKKYRTLTLVWFLLPLFTFLILYQRSESHPFYLLSWVPILVLLLSEAINLIFSSNVIAGGLILGYFLFVNSFGLTKEIVSKDHLAQPADPNLIGYNDEIRVIDYIYSDARNEQFGYFSYNITPYWADQNFQYLFKWYGQSHFGYVPLRNGGDRIYVITEPEPYLGIKFQQDWLKQFMISPWRHVSDPVFLGEYTIRKFEKTP